MPAAVRLVRLPPGADPFAIAATGPALRLVPTPTHAAAVPIPTAVGPVVLDIQSFADEIVRAFDPATKPLTDAHRRLLIEQAAAELRDAGDLPAVTDSAGFYATADAVVRDGTPPPAELAKLVALVERKRQKLHRLGPADRMRRAADLWRAGKREPFADVRAVHALGFDPMPELILTLLAAIADSVDELVVTVPDEPGDGRAEAFAPVREGVARLTRFGAAANLFDPPEVDTTVAGPAVRPAGIAHLAATLFHEPPLSKSDDANGVRLIEAPGTVAEARLVARDIRRKLADGVVAERIVVTARRPDRVAGVLAEVFDEYAVPFDRPTPDPLARVPAVAALLKAWRLPDDDFPFPAVAALLRSTVVRFNVTSVRTDADAPAVAETVLRRIAVAGGRDAILAAVAKWAEKPPLPLEDEQAEEPRRRRLHADAKRVKPFVEQLLKLWDRVPKTTGPATFAGHLFRLAADLGLTADPELAPFRHAVNLWATADWPLASSRKTVSKAAFTRALVAIAATTPGPPRPTGGRVRVLPVDHARGADCDHLYIIDLGEGEFPAGTASLPAEMRLFLDLVARPRVELCLSFPAVDEKGQPLLPASFLRAVGKCFTAVPTESRRMPIERYAADELMSAAEVRVRVARDLAAGRDIVPFRSAKGSPFAERKGTIDDDLLANLRAAHAATIARGRGKPFGSFDGFLAHPAVAAKLLDQLGPAKVLSPTALETYIACPFRFWLQHVLKLEPLDDPGDAVEHTRRGSAVHRALSRFHEHVRDHATDYLNETELPAAADADLEHHLMRAVGEYAARAADAGTKVLWELEGRRLVRSLAKYRRQWDKFREPWPAGEKPVPHAFEADFGGESPLVLTVGDTEIRLGGRIDRVDVADGGFWVIDYKTGRGAAYTARAVGAFERVQLPLYAVAVERLLLTDTPARPLGLAYWMVTAGGVKNVLPGGGKQTLALFADAAKWEAYRDQLLRWVGTLVEHLRAGHFPLAPKDRDHCTDTCPFGPTCRITSSRPAEKEWRLALPIVDRPA